MDIGYWKRSGLLGLNTRLTGCSMVLEIPAFHQAPGRGNRGVASHLPRAHVLPACRKWYTWLALSQVTKGHCPCSVGCSVQEASQEGIQDNPNSAPTRSDSATAPITSTREQGRWALHGITPPKLAPLGTVGLDEGPQIDVGDHIATG